jgi:hypothetical protein
MKLYKIIKSDLKKLNSDFTFVTVQRIHLAPCSDQGCQVALLKSNIEFKYIVKSDLEKSNSDFTFVI